MSFGQPFPNYAANLHNPQFLLAAAAASAAANSNNKSTPGSIGVGAPSDPRPSSTTTIAASTAGIGANFQENGAMSAESLRLLAAATGHGLLPPPGSTGPAPPGPPMTSGPPMFAGLPSLDPYRLPPPPFGLYSGGISPAGGPLDLKVPDGLAPPPFTHPAPSAITPFYYDPAFGSAYPYAADRFGNPLDLNGARRKNATRETTAALKAWLYEHRKNPYPTKGEKIMLAIITKMTLTQVSTWFANARRRLKKENKMTWSPRNRPGEDDDGNSNTQENSAGQRPGSSLSSLGDDPRDQDDDADMDDLDTDTVAVACNSNDDGAKRLGHGLMKDSDIKSEASASVKEASEEKKPKIWSIAETVASPDSSPQKPKPSSTESPQQQQHGPFHFTFPPWPHMAAAAAFAGRNSLVPPPNSASNNMAGMPPPFPFGVPASPFGFPPGSLPHPHQLRPELFARNFFAPTPTTSMAGNLPGFLNGFAFGCGPPPFPFGFGLPNMGNGTAIAAVSQAQSQQQQQNGGGVEAADGRSSENATNSNPATEESKLRNACTSSPTESTSNDGRRSSNSSRESKTS